ncbi:hypothetical protein PsYK624_058200 [Phanerochaete sordida]|uniref:Uncharacterized protein n=1 Tax=Phanerochaete sordida TaxID=48140 RepID=A0A9P3G8E3_9APHY|nr:hypothetical protein PsYK624_058200 [Phanerochaete sordida]
MLRTTFRAVAVASDTGRAVGRDIYINGTRAHPSRSCQIAGLTYLAVHAPHGAGPRRVIRAQSSRLRTRVSREGHGVSSSVALLSEAGPAKAGCAATLRSLRGRSGASCQPSFPCQPSRDIFPCRIWSRRSTARSARSSLLL